MIKILNEESVPIKKAEVGIPSKQDIIELHNTQDETKRAILCFNVRVPIDIEVVAKDLGIQIFSHEIIYRLIDNYKEWVKAIKERASQEKLMRVTHPCEVKILSGTVFRQSNPAVFGVEILRGTLKPDVTMMKGKKIIDDVKEIQREGKLAQEARKGEKVAISMENVTVGRQVKEGDIMEVKLSQEDVKLLREIFDKLPEDEKELLKETS